MNDQARRWRPAAVFTGIAACYVLVDVIFFWPTARFDTNVFYTRQFDLYGVLWMVRHVRQVLFDGVVQTTNWPLGENAGRPDAYLLALFALGTRGTLSPLSLVRLVAMAGPVAGALAAEHCANQGFHVRRPWSLMAGLIYGFNGLAATAWLEGHVYFLFNPWLPLMLLSLVRATRTSARSREAVKAGLYWVLALATSAYAGIAASILVVVMAARGMVTTRGDSRVIRRLALTVATFLPFGLLYVGLFFAGSGQRAPDLWRASTSGGATLAGLVSWWPGVDGQTYHSIATPIGFVTLFLAALAPVLLKRYPGWRTLLATASGALLLSFGPAISPGMGMTGGIPGPMALFVGTPVMTFLHFPVRFLWLTYLCGGLVAARVADELARRSGTLPALPLLAMGLVDAVALTGAPFRAEGVLATIPSAYKVAPPDRAVLDLFAGQPPVLGDISTRVTKLTTYYHTVHGRPVLSAALPTYGQNCRDRVAGWVISSLLGSESKNQQPKVEDKPDLETGLADLGIGAVAVHTDLFPRADVLVILKHLRATLGPPAVISRDGGETIALFVLRKRSAADPVERYRWLLSHQGPFSVDP